MTTKADGVKVKLTAMQRRALEQVAECGRRGRVVERGLESVTQVELVDAGLLYQEIERGAYKFTLSESGRKALEQK